MGLHVHGFYKGLPLNGLSRFGAMVHIAVLLAITTLSLQAMAQDETKTNAQAESKTIAKNKSKPKEVALQNRWSLSTSISHSVPMKQDLKQLSAIGVGVDNNYFKTETMSLSGGLDLEAINAWVPYPDESTRTIDSLGLYMSSRFVIDKPTSQSISTGLSLGLPVNKADNKAGFRFSVSVPTAYSFQWGTQRISLNLVPTYLNYQYDTQGINSASYNKKWTVSTGIGITSPLIEESLYWTNAVGIFNYENYKGNSIQAYSLSTSMSYKFTPSLSTTAGFYSGDRLVTYRRVLDDDLTSFRMSLSWEI